MDHPHGTNNGQCAERGFSGHARMHVQARTHAQTTKMGIISWTAAGAAQEVFVKV